jgi:copper resistance protein B
MSPLRIALLAASASVLLVAPAQAQHQGHSMPGMTMPKAAPATRKPPARKAKPAAKKKSAVKKAAPAKKKVVRRKRAAQALRAKADKPAAARTADPHAGHVMTEAPAPMTGGEMPVAADPHAGHAMGGTPGARHAVEGTDLAAGNAPPPPYPSDHAADAVYGAKAMAMGRHHLATMHGGQKFSKVMLNIAEYQARGGRDGFEWDGEAWVGGDIDRLWIKSEGDGEIGGSVERAEVQALLSHAIDPYFNLQGGLRYDVRPNPSRVYAVLGVEGLAPRFFNVEGALFLSNKGELLARAEGSYDQRITQRLILQPRLEVNLAAQDSRAIGVGAGLSDAEVGLRLRYEIVREFAPYIGVQYRSAFGRTRDFLRDAGEDRGGFSLLMGVRAWF